MTMSCITLQEHSCTFLVAATNIWNELSDNVVIASFINSFLAPTKVLSVSAPQWTLYKL